MCCSSCVFTVLYLQGGSDAFPTEAKGTLVEEEEEEEKGTLVEPGRGS